MRFAAALAIVTIVLGSAAVGIAILAERLFPESDHPYGWGV
jgi:hypothetical protein